MAPGFIVTNAAKVLCFHGGQITFSPSEPVMFVNKAAVLTSTDASAAVVTCAAQPPVCASLQWANVALAVEENGVGVLLYSGLPTDAQCLDGSKSAVGAPQVSIAQTIAEGT